MPYMIAVSLEMSDEPEIRYKNEGEESLLNKNKTPSLTSLGVKLGVNHVRY